MPKHKSDYDKSVDLAMELGSIDGKPGGDMNSLDKIAADPKLRRKYGADPRIPPPF